MKCPVCGLPTSVLRTKAAEDGASIGRQRGCGNAAHRFETVERRAAATLDKVLVRRMGTGALGPGTFDQARLLADVRKGVLKRLSETETAEVVRGAVHDLEAHLAALLKPLDEEEQARRPGHPGAIDDRDITEAVERQLVKSSSRMAHVLYALYIRGRSDRRNRPGWASARDVLEWLHQPDNYPHLSAALPDAPPVAVDTWFPAAAAPQPASVIKRPQDRAAAARTRPDRVPFSLRQFQNGIAEALSGRPDADTKAHCVVQWVLWGLAGQTDVHSSQLAVGVLDCLRRVDDVAYLRWASIAKNIDSVTAFNTEALGLMTHPSPRLVFELEKARPLPKRVPGGGPSDGAGRGPVPPAAPSA